MQQTIESLLLRPQVLGPVQLQRLTSCNRQRGGPSFRLVSPHRVSGPLTVSGRRAAVAAGPPDRLLCVGSRRTAGLLGHLLLPRYGLRRLSTLVQECSGRRGAEEEWSGVGRRPCCSYWLDNDGAPPGR